MDSSVKNNLEFGTSEHDLNNDANVNEANVNEAIVNEANVNEANVNDSIENEHYLNSELDILAQAELDEIENLMDKLDDMDHGINNPEDEMEKLIQKEDEKYVGERFDVIEACIKDAMNCNNSKINDEFVANKDYCLNNEFIENEIICGIDLGTSNSCITVWRNNKPEVIPDYRGNLTIPSFVSFGNCTRYIGIEAKNQSELNPENTYYEVKRLIGRLYKERNVQLDKPFFT